MHSTLVLVAVALPFALAAPSYRLPSELSRRQGAGSCKLAETPQPPNTMTPPASDLTLALIAVGHGTQNYTCADSATSTIPAAIGAVAQLFNASCSVADNLPNLGSITEDGAAIGAHFFFDNTTPEFDIIGLGDTRAKKVQTMAAPSPTDVPWLRLEAQTEGTTSPVKQVYRLNTKGGVAPKNCGGVAPGVVTVEYTAQYWVYASEAEIATRKMKRRLGTPVI